MSRKGQKRHNERMGRDAHNESLYEAGKTVRR